MKIRIFTLILIDIGDGNGNATEAFKVYHKRSPNQKIHDRDVVRLYPTVNALDEDAVGFPSYVDIKVNDIATGRFFGVATVNIAPPKDLKQFTSYPTTATGSYYST